MVSNARRHAAFVCKCCHRVASCLEESVLLGTQRIMAPWLSLRRSWSAMKRPCGGLGLHAGILPVYASKTTTKTLHAWRNCFFLASSAFWLPGCPSANPGIGSSRCVFACYYHSDLRCFALLCRRCCYAGPRARSADMCLVAAVTPTQVLLICSAGSAVECHGSSNRRHVSCCCRSPDPASAALLCRRCCQ